MAKKKEKMSRLDTDASHILETQRRWRACQSFARDVYHSSMSSTDLSIYLFKCREILAPFIGDTLRAPVEDEQLPVID